MVLGLTKSSNQSCVSRTTFILRLERLIIPGTGLVIVAIEIVSNAAKTKASYG